MRYKQFLSYIRSAIQTYMGPDVSVSLRRTLKNNNHYLDGLTVLQPGANVSPTVYLNSYYQDFLDGMPLDDIVETIRASYEQFPRRQPIDPMLFQDFEKARPGIAYRLCHFASNRPLLKQIPHIPKLDLAIIFFLVIDSSPDEEMTVTITQEQMETWNISEQLLYETAALNTPLLYPCRCMSLEQMISELCSFKADTSGCRESLPLTRSSSLPMYVLTNKRRINGAACILYDQVLQKFSQQVGGDFFILPSSVHETILLPCQEQIKTEALTAMVREINDTEVSPMDRLSDHIYRYSARTEQMSIC